MEPAHLAGIGNQVVVPGIDFLFVVEFVDLKFQAVFSPGLFPVLGKIVNDLFRQLYLLFRSANDNGIA